jgi:hypothetical protein
VKGVAVLLGKKVNGKSRKHGGMSYGVSLEGDFIVRYILELGFFWF